MVPARGWREVNIKRYLSAEYHSAYVAGAYDISAAGV